MTIFKDAGHLVRLACVFLGGIVLFLILRSVLVPRSFGEYGHYRGNAIKEIAARPVKYAGREACETCHTDIVDVKKTGRHARLSCEVCHGALAAHADDPGSVQPVKPDTAVLCAGCHEASTAKPKTFPQVHAEEHSAGVPCETCHNPHSPAIAAGGKK